MSKDLEDSWEGNFPTNREIKPSTDLNISSNDTTGGDKLKIGVCSWNIGNHMKKIESLIDSLPSTDSDILIIGFQELPVTLLEGTNKSISDKYSSIEDRIHEKIKDKYVICETMIPNLNPYTCINTVSSATGFGITTFVFNKKEINVQIIQKNDNFYSYTKGYLALKIQIDNGETIDIINVHAPLNTIAESKKFFVNMLERTKNNSFSSPFQILFGDMNSRSIMTNNCALKKVTNCKSTTDIVNNSKYCSVKKTLELLSLTETLTLLPKTKKSRMKVIPLSETMKNCDIKDRISVHRFTRQPEPESNRERLDRAVKISNTKLETKSIQKPVPPEIKSTVSDLIKILSMSDVLRTHMDTWFPGFQEQAIRFLPSYKRNMKNGTFSLSKGNEGRLPGYADRIFVKNELGNIENHHYCLLNVKGNDHLPLFGEYTFYQNPNEIIVDKALGGKTKCKRKNRCKSKNTTRYKRTQPKLKKKSRR